MTSDSLKNATQASVPDFISRQVKSSRYFWSDCGTEEPAGFEIVCGGFEACRPDYRIDRRDFPWFAFELVVGGRGQLQIGGRDYPLQKGVSYLYGPGTAHRIDTDPDDSLEKYFVTLHGLELRTFLNELDLDSGTVLQNSAIQPVARAFEELIVRGTRNTRLSERICTTLVRQILLTSLEDGHKAGASGTRAFATYDRVRRHINDHFLTIDSVESIAVACSLDAAYLSRLFSRFQEESPHQYLTRLRMEHAARLLLESDAPIQEIAGQLGFKDPFRFSRVFKSVHRLPPSRFRQGLQSPPSQS